jgi:Replication initiator protein A
MQDSAPRDGQDPRTTLRSTGGRDELNLAEFPITLLTDRAPDGCKTLVFQDEVFDQQSGQMVPRKLTVTGSDAYGLPTAHDDEVLVALLQLTKLANNFSEPRVGFSRYELLKLLGWRDCGENYGRIEESLNRWLGVSLYYEKAW